MKLGGPVFGDLSTPELWIAAVQHEGYRTAYCPLEVGAAPDTVRAYAEAAHSAYIPIAEVGAWSNPLSPDEDERAQAREKCKASLQLADDIGARYCVNITGSRGPIWDGPHPANLTDETFEMIVDCTREILDDAAPRRAFYTLETMPWMFPDGPDSYLRLIEAIDRPQLAVHFDPVNLICSPQRYFANGDFIRECFALLGPYIVGCHAKDIVLHPKLTVHLDEARPGLGHLDYRVFLRELNRLDPDIPLLLEHLPEEEYPPAAAHLRGIAGELGIEL